MFIVIEKAIWFSDFQRALQICDPDLGDAATLVAANLVWPSAFMLEPAKTAASFLAGQGIPAPTSGAAL